MHHTIAKHKENSPNNTARTPPVKSSPWPMQHTAAKATAQCFPHWTSAMPRENYSQHTKTKPAESEERENSYPKHLRQDCHPYRYATSRKTLQLPLPAWDKWQCHTKNQTANRRGGTSSTFFMHSRHTRHFKLKRFLEIFNSVFH